MVFFLLDFDKVLVEMKHPLINKPAHEIMKASARTSQKRHAATILKLGFIYAHINE